jgi:hypothetical protein
MCFWGSSNNDTPAVAPPPDPSPTPVQPSKVEGQVTSEERRRKLERMRRGLQSTIKTSSRGLTGSGADLLAQTLVGRDKLGA